MSAAFAHESFEPQFPLNAVESDTVAPVIPLNALPVADADFEFGEIAPVLSPRFPAVRSTFAACRDLEGSATIHIREHSASEERATKALCGTPFALGSDMDVTVGSQGRLDATITESTCGSCREEWTFFTAWDAVA